MLTPRQMKRVILTEDGHMLWTGGLANGYPAGKYQGKTVYLKRIIWEELHGPIPEGLVVTSTCGQRTCIQPSHLGLAAPGRYPSVRNALGRYAPAATAEVSPGDPSAADAVVADSASPAAPGA